MLEESCVYCDWMADHWRDDGLCERCGRMTDRMEALDAAETTVCTLAQAAGWQVDRIVVAETQTRYVDLSHGCARAACDETVYETVRVADHMPGPLREGTSWEIEIPEQPRRWAALRQRLERAADCGEHE